MDPRSLQSWKNVHARSVPAHLAVGNVLCGLAKHSQHLLCLGPLLGVLQMVVTVQCRSPISSLADLHRSALLDLLDW